MANIDDIVKTRFTSDKHRFVTNMIYTANWLQNQFVDFLKPFGISPQQFNVLRILRGAKEEWVTMNDIKSLMIDKAPNATRLSDKLLDKDYVKRKRSESDRRIVYLSITSKGLALLKEIDGHDEMFSTDRFNGISEEEAKLCSEIIDRLRDAD
ncbi:MarR family winged helix-turn-helix transcriptional regulator [Flammeovirga sp. EKP202]|uniref:MarR family winged helix-turn-helix transcriptional regulator n=1 Tax=Flammeovirga sp. EKP202 TaxID=2770592 RepID=UPI00165FD609|nr:MarR family transcriptional regulator [Flammeovirga sp. EKP202]MBD0405410.1 MarR family transcriptional regulator [Flammeovirga sp. EKP202]